MKKHNTKARQIKKNNFKIKKFKCYFRSYILNFSERLKFVFIYFRAL